MYQQRHITIITATAAVLAAVLTFVALPPAAAAAEGDEARTQRTPNPMLIAEGAKYWSTQCQRCHNLRDPSEFTDEIWDVSVNHMRIRANIPTVQIEAIKAFLKASN